MSRLRKRPFVDHRAAAVRLRARPGVWLPVGEYRSLIGADATAYVIRTATSKCGPAYTPPGAFETRTELTEYGVQVLARYLGGDGRA